MDRLRWHQVEHFNESKYFQTKLAQIMAICIAQTRLHIKLAIMASMQQSNGYVSLFFDAAAETPNVT